MLEEAPAPNLAEDIRQDLWEKARAAALAVGYEGAGTVECIFMSHLLEATLLTSSVIFDNDTNEFFFMEMNTRLQVEHPVTEAITGEDLVAWQFAVASGAPLPLSQDEIASRIAERGWAFEARIYAENPVENFMPDSGKLIHLRTPKITEDVRIDAGFVQGDTVSSAYDGMIAKLIVRGPTREVAIRKLHAALQDYEVVGLSTNIEFLKRVCKSSDFIAGDVETGYIQKHHAELFELESIPAEAYAQAALGLLSQKLSSSQLPGPHGQAIGFDFSSSRSFHLATYPPTTPPTPPTTVEVSQISPSLFSCTISPPSAEPTKYDSLQIRRTSSQSHTTYFPHTRLASTLISSRINDEDRITLFQQGRQFQFQLVRPGWFEKAMGLKDVANSVRAPMPCKVLRNEVREGEEVEIGQALVV